MEKLSVKFAAIDPYIQDNIIENIQKEIKGQEMVQYGDKNIYPNYVDNLFESVSCLKSIIIGLADYICGENVTISLPQYQETINNDGETIEDVVKQMAQSYVEYGGFALNVVRNRIGGIAGVYCLDFKNVRSDKKNTKFYYSEDWANKSLGRIKNVVYPAFDPNDKTQASSILYVKNDKKTTYPSPMWGGATMSAEILKHINEFHLNSIYNGLSSDYVVNFNAGQPTPEAQEEIEDTWSEKFTGFQNGGRQILSFNPDIQHRTQIEPIPQSNYIDKFNAIEKTSKQDIYSAFRCHPVLFGLPTENSGFNDQDFQEAFKLVNKTVVLPIQKVIKRAFEKLFQEKEVIEIEPFNIDWSEDANDELVK